MTNIQLEKIKGAEQKWDFTLVGAMITAVVGATIGAPLLQGAEQWQDWLVSGSVAVMVSAPIIMLIAEKLDELVRQRWVKGYYIEDCGDVIKLYGEVRLIKMDQAYRDLLTLRPDFHVVEDAYGKFGCTLAAVKATPSELDAKGAVASMGIPIRIIG